MVDIELIGDGAIAAIMINRPERGNMLTYSAVLELIASAHEIAEDDQARAIILTGNGRDFSLGSPPDRTESARRLQPAHLATED
jgi:enoyl-CoA hydratase/carnithine racemase